MATFDASARTSGIDMTTFDVAGLESGTPTNFSKADYQLNTATGFQEFLGTDFTYDVTNHLTGGTIHDITVVDKGVTLFEISNLHLDFTDFDAFVQASDSQGFSRASSPTMTTSMARV